MPFIELSDREEFLATRIVNAAYIVHKELGPGLLEKIYEMCMAHVLLKEGIKTSRQTSFPVYFQGIKFDEGFRMDLYVENLIICEIKSFDEDTLFGNRKLSVI